jgi:hypothetical protein
MYSGFVTRTNNQVSRLLLKVVEAKFWQKQ